MSTALAIKNGTGDDLALYYQHVSRFDLMSPEEERETARRWFDEGDVDAAHALVTANLRFVIKVANEYRHYGLRTLDLIQEGNLGLMRAVRKFDPHKGYRLITYAVWWIRAQIHDFILRSWSLVRMGTSRAQRRLFNKLQSAQSRIRGLVDAPDSNAENQLLSAELDIPLDDVVNFRARVNSRDISLDQPLLEDGSPYVTRLSDSSADQEQVVVEDEARQRLAVRVTEAIGALPERDRLIAQARLLADEPRTLQDLGDELGVSKERIRQLEARIKNRLRESLADCELEFA